MNTELKIESAITPGETVPGVQICPFGEFKGEKSLQICDSTAFAQVVADWVANGSKELLMDFEHQSEVPKIDSDTKAAAWISNIRVDSKLGLVGDFKFTDEGADAVTNRRLRFLSPTWYTGDDGRPTHMTSVALTNKPNIPVAPILNKSSIVESCELRVEGSAPDAQPSTLNPQPTTQTKGPQMDIEKIKQALGLPAEATEEQVLAAIKECQDAKAKADELQANAEKKALEDEAEEFAEANAKKCNKEVLKAQYIANKDVARALVAGIPDAPKADEPQKILNKAQTPADAENKELQRNKAIGDYRKAHGCDFQTAWAACRASAPEIFAD